MDILTINGKPSEMSIFASDELARSVMISLFLGRVLMTTTRLKDGDGMASGAIPMPIRENAQGQGFGSCVVKRSRRRPLREYVSTRRRH